MALPEQRHQVDICSDRYPYYDGMDDELFPFDSFLPCLNLIIAGIDIMQPAATAANTIV